MTRTARLLCTAALVPLGLPAAAVTPEEVWALFIEVTEATGAAMTGTTTRNGDVMTASDVKVSYSFPFGAGDLTFALGDIIFAEGPDDTVVMSYPGDTVEMAVAGTLTIEGETATGSALITIAMPGQSTIASGTADDITVVSTTPMQTIEVSNLDASIPGEDFDLSAFSATGATQDGALTARYTREADVYRITSSGSQGVSFFDLSIPGDDGIVTTQSSGSAASVYEVELVLPKTPMSILNLSAAVRNGLALTADVDTTDAFSRSVTTIDAEPFTDQTQTLRRQLVTVSFGDGGLLADVEGTGIDMKVTIPELLPFPIAATIASATGDFALPLLASPSEAFTIEYDVVLEGMEMAEDLWALFDPAQQLPRDPVDLTLDLGADVRPAVDPLDIMGIMSTAQSATPDMGISPFLEIDEVRLDALKLAAVGVLLEGRGAFTLDFNDFDTFPDMPRPEGTASMTLSGTNALIDRLLEMGLITDQDAMPARMGIGMFTTPVGEDVVESEVEITPEGQVFVNGQRMR